MKTPVLLVCFSRPLLTQLLTQAIYETRPLRLYVAVDGPRQSQPTDYQKVAQVRDIIDNIDWTSKIFKLYHTTNLGCKAGPERAISWFFEHEQEGIILEDDCLPSPSFFQYCEILLDRYRDDKDVWHICGNNFGIDKKYRFDYSYTFGSYAQVWGWATWRDRWRNMIVNPFYLEERAQPRSWPINFVEKQNKKHHISLLKNGLKTWDYQWQITVLNNKGLVVYPAVNLIRNIGDGPDATHTKKNDGRMRLDVGELSPINHNSSKKRNPVFDRHYAENMGLRNYRIPLMQAKGHLDSIIDSSKIRLRRKLLKPAQFSVVIASTGRAGSTMLYDTVAQSWHLFRLRFWAENIFHSNHEIIKREAWRLENRNFQRGVVYKTHDLPPTNIADQKDVKYIFIYGDPVDSCLSVDQMVKKNGVIWLEEHLFHLRGHGSYNDLYKKDILNYEQQVKQWTTLKYTNILIIKYDELWDKLDELQDFLGFPVDIPAKRRRSEKEYPAEEINWALFNHLRSLYST